VFTGIVDSDWPQLVEEYRKAKQVGGLQEVSIYKGRLTLRHFERVVGACSSRQVTQQVLDQFILERGKELRKSTLNKDIRNLGSFINRAIKNRYAAAGLVVKTEKVPQRPVQPLTPQQVKDLITAAADYPALRLRILLATTTGLRRSDIQTIRVGDIHFDRNTITTRSWRSDRLLVFRWFFCIWQSPLPGHCGSLPQIALCSSLGLKEHSLNFGSSMTKDHTQDASRVVQVRHHERPSKTTRQLPIQSDQAALRVPQIGSRRHLQ
jgi:hypothetical protein